MSLDILGTCVQANALLTVKTVNVIRAIILVFPVTRNFSATDVPFPVLKTVRTTLVTKQTARAWLAKVAFLEVDVHFHAQNIAKTGFAILLIAPACLVK